MAQPTGIEIYKASAGSGKTFQLTLQYLLLALNHPQAFTQIQAVTFTNKATAEMKHRILWVLQSLANASPSAQGYTQKILAQNPAFTEETLRTRANEVYKNILHNYSKLSVTTIDVFVQKILRSFSWELGIDNGFELVLNTEPVKKALAERLYKRLDHDASLRKWMVDFAQERLQAGKNWDFKADMFALASELFQEQFLPFEEFIQTHSEELPARFQQLQQKVNSALGGIRQKWQNEARNLLHAFAQKGLTVADFYYGTTGFYGWLRKTAEGAITMPPNRVLQAAQGGKLASNSSEKQTSIAELAPQITATLQQFIDWSTVDLAQYATALAIKKNLELLRILAVFVEELAHYRNDENVILISDTHKLLRQLSKNTNASFIYEKTGTRFKYYLIDEFQDTSGFQWDNFLPLIEESLGSGNYTLLVGDVKQAIYRWRNGDWRLLLFQAQNQLQAFKPVEQVLNQNFRSTRQVVEVNNFLFRGLPLLLQANLQQDFLVLSPPLKAWLQETIYGELFIKAYADAQQALPPDAPNNGLVQIQWIAKNKSSSEIEESDHETSSNTESFPYLYRQIQQLLKEGFLPGQIGILVRKNKEAAQIVAYLLQVQQTDPESVPFSIISGEGLLLRNNPIINTIIAAIQLAVSGGSNNLALAQIRASLAQAANRPLTNHRQFSPGQTDPHLPINFNQQILEISSLNLPDFVHAVVLLLQLNQYACAQTYLQALYDLVQAFAAKGRPLLSEFLVYWEEESGTFSLPASPSSNSMEVVTIHKSKGLAYDVVLMPLLDWELSHKNQSPLLWAATEATPFPEIPIFPVDYGANVANSDFAPAYVAEKSMSTLDNLNLMYVAFTRARQRIYAWSVYKPGSKLTQHMGSLLLHLIKQTPANELPGTFDPELQMWTHLSGLAPTLAVPTIASNTYTHPIYSPWQHAIKTRYAPLSVNEEDSSLPRTQGLIMHAILSQLNHPGDLKRVLAEFENNGLLLQADATKMAGTLSNLLAMPVLAPWGLTTYRKLSERKLINHSRQIRRPDLVLFNQFETRVYDFKFVTAQTADQYHRQVLEYLQILKSLGFAKPSGFIVYAKQLTFTTVSIES